ncbi:ABC transporter ATP-binding protein [Azohydromonas aeria]|uniref:ABC transporter ATP-binding protein n=1 Tax=Azohydromonas aeria TaxID=2590212 RepID=UPI0012FAA344|nr:ABC transporter ATP-binding protein [Azohydromonas aeria]
MSAPLLEVQVHRKRLGGREVLRDLALSLREGEIAALVGASGCGKSTLLRLVAALDQDFEGTVRLDGRAVAAPSTAIRIVFQEPRLFPWLSVAQNIGFDGRGSAQDRARIETLLAEVGLPGLGERLPRDLSGGQAQRVALARALFVQPRLLLLDEPFSAVDAFTRVKLQALLLRLVRAHRIGVLLVTHDIDEAVALGERVLVLRSDPGHVAAQVEVPVEHPRDRDDQACAAAAAAVRRALHEVHAF